VHTPDLEGCITGPAGITYAALHRLERRSWLEASWGESENGRQAKFYKLSAKGRRQLTKEESNWQRL
jgi:DNA-binding PadR family transcriptional regulator